MSNQGNGRSSGTMGESTRQRLAAIVQAAKSGSGDAGAGIGRPGSAGANYVGGFQGSLHGTWGRAATGRSGSAASNTQKAKNPILGGQAPRPPAAVLPQQQRRQEIQAEFRPRIDRVRPASSGAKNVWDVLPNKTEVLYQKQVLRNQTQQFHASRPRSAAPRLQHGQQQNRTGGRDLEDDYRIRGSALGGHQQAAAAHSCAAGNSSSFDAESFSFAAGEAAGHRPPSARARPTSARAAPAAPANFERLSVSSPAAGGGGAAAADLTEGRLARLEDNIRDTLRARRSVYEDSKTMLLKMFKEVDDGSGDVQIPEFCEVCSKLGVSVSPAEAAALFKRAGYESSMPYQKWAHNLITQPSRQLAQESAVRKGAFQPGQSANFTGKIIYEECRKPVWTPSSWDPKLAERSAELPDARLGLEFAYGYAGAQATSQNLFYNCLGQAVYFLAGVGVVYHKPPEHRQHFFLGHIDDIKSLALCPAAVQAGEQQYPAKCLVATGQVSSTSDGPTICVWDSRIGSPTAASPPTDSSQPPPDPQVAKLQLDKEYRGIVALGFSPDGALLAGVATDNAHTVTVWDWRAGWRVVGEGKGCMGEPPQVFGLEWNPHQLTHRIEAQFVTFGKKHIKMWRPAGPGGAWTATQLSFGKLPLQNVMSAAFLTPRGPQNECMLVAGMADGQAYLFKGITPVSAIAAHKPGPKSIQPDGQPAYEGLRGMRLCKQGKMLLTGGADGVIMQWDVSDGTLADGKFAGPSITLKHPFGTDKTAPVVRSLDYQDDNSGNILVGTLDSCIWEVSATGAQQDILIAGHQSDVWGVAMHPDKPNIAATVCDGNRVMIWDLQARQLLRSASVGFVCRAVTFSSTAYADGGHHLAVGGAKGHIRVVTEAELRPIWEGRDSTQGISELDFSPDGKLLAAATFDAWIDIYNVEKKYQRIARCSGHSATVRTIDWSIDSSVLQSNCAAREILYWNPRTGKQMPSSCRDVEWAGWTCIYGFPVMGIWPDTADGSDINAVDRSKSCKFLATCDDYGLVKLFNYPVVIEDAPHRAYRGHSSHVMCVRFNSDDTLVCSTGGKDWALFQFRVVPVDPAEVAGAAAEAVAGAGTASGLAMGLGGAKKGLAGGAGGKKDAGKGDMVWGPLDATGRNFGWVPAGSAAAATSQASATTAAAATPVQQQQQPAAAVHMVPPQQQQQQQQAQFGVKRYSSGGVDDETNAFIEEDVEDGADDF